MVVNLLYGFYTVLQFLMGQFLWYNFYVSCVVGRSTKLWRRCIIEMLRLQLSSSTSLTTYVLLYLNVSY